MGESRHTANMVKSPSDTTIYVPALAKSPIGGTHNPNVEQPLNALISNFVDNVRLETKKDGNLTAFKIRREGRRLHLMRPPGLEEARVLAGNAIIEAQKFEATVAPPNSGNIPNIQLNFSRG